MRIEWWIWLSIGLGLLGLEMFIPTGMYLLIIGLAFLVVGGLTALGVLATSQVQMIAAAILTIVMIFTIRRPFQSLLARLSKPMGSDITAQIVTASEAIAVGAIGKGELSGATWSVKNETSKEILPGARLAVSRVDGLMLIVK